MILIFGLLDSWSGISDLEEFEFIEWSYESEVLQKEIYEKCCYNAHLVHNWYILYDARVYLVQCPYLYWILSQILYLYSVYNMHTIVHASAHISNILWVREYWMIYRRPGHLAVVCPPPFPCQSSASDTQEDWEKIVNLLSGEGRGTKSYDCETAFTSINWWILSAVGGSCGTHAMLSTCSCDRGGDIIIPSMSQLLRVGHD